MANTSLPGMFLGATASTNGSIGLVPQPIAGQENFVLLGDGSWSPGASVTTVWSVVTSSTALADGNGYFANSASTLTFTLPATSAVGDTYQIAEMNSGAFTIAQRASQAIIFNGSTTTTGIGGSITLTSTGGTISVVCNVANTRFQVLTSLGEFTVT